MTDEPTPDVLARLDEHDVRLDKHDGHLERHDIQIERLNTGFGVLQTGQQHILQQLAEERGEGRERARSQKERDNTLSGKIDKALEAISKERGARDERQRLFNRNTTWAVVVLAGLGTLLGWQEFGQTIWHSILHLKEPAG
ncbi:hypothetical protein [Komagataeibacter intermedius]|uniref:Mobilization protein n=1 Tax=Komagataeibacter intermedius NRIC 0521 TaxID=1307934 RepID=A0ABQ0PNH0_9PROT|nr:hypothetical protein [Komagataeibacter intermedius]GAN88578.1 hypothetical protein Gain_0252_002 [Komagataeibacter intermedius TF2]GBQ76598.1 hypothetical protein AA0521_2917 [Komagataeibacter intermedius NRIC 0521]